jgi:hypothetical protein
MIEDKHPLNGPLPDIVEDASLHIAQAVPPLIIVLPRDFWAFSTTNTDNSIPQKKGQLPQ